MSGLADLVGDAAAPLLDGSDRRSLTDDVIAALRTVQDPEIPVNLYDLGLIYRIEVTEAGLVEIDMTLTAPGCPVAGEMASAVGSLECSTDYFRQFASSARSPAATLHGCSQETRTVPRRVCVRSRRHFGRLLLHLLSGHGWRARGTPLAAIPADERRIFADDDLSIDLAYN